MKKQMEIYLLLTKEAFDDELERKYLDKTIQNQYETNSAKTIDGKTTIYRPMTELAQEIQEKKLISSEKTEDESSIRYKFKANNDIIEVIVPKEMIEQGENTRYDFIPKTIEMLEQTNKKAQNKYVKNLKIKKNITKAAIGVTVLAGSFFSIVKITDDLNQKERIRQSQNNKYSVYYEFYKDIMPYDKFVEMVENQQKAYENIKSK